MYLRFVETDVACCVVSIGGLGCRYVGAGLISGAIIELDFFFFLRVSRVGGSNGSGSSGMSLLISLLNVDSGGDGLECSMGAYPSSGIKLNCGGESRMLCSSWTRLSSSWGLKKMLATWSGKPQRSLLQSPPRVIFVLNDGRKPPIFAFHHVFCPRSRLCRPLWPIKLFVAKFPHLARQ